MTAVERREVRVTGGCQCGAVRYRATAMLQGSAHICHCRMCQKAVGGPFAAFVAAPNDAFEWTAGTPASFRSSSEALRGFCADCGTPLFYLGEGAEHINVTIASLDDPAAFPPEAQVGTESRLPWFATLPGLRDLGETAADDPAWRDRVAASNRQRPDRD